MFAAELLGKIWIQTWSMFMHQSDFVLRVRAMLVEKIVIFRILCSTQISFQKMILVHNPCSEFEETKSELARFRALGTFRMV